jgi:hypothetical protein
MSIIKHNSIFFVLQVSQKSQTPSTHGGGSLIVSAPPMWPPPSSTRFWSLLGPAFSCPPPHPYLGQPGGIPHPQTGQGYLSSSTPWGSPPGWQVSLPFGLPPLRTPLLRPMTSTSPTVRQAYIKLGFVCLLDYFTFLTRSFTCLSRQLRITTRCRIGIQLHRRPLQHDGRIRGQRRDAVDSVLLSLVVNYIVLSCRTCFAFHVVNYIVDLL